MTTLYLVRHGRTVLNAQGRFRGREDPPLDEQGAEDAHAAAGRLAGLDVVVEEGLNDLDHGAWTALTPAEAAEGWPAEFARFRERPRAAAAPGGETMPDVEERLMRTLDLLAERHRGAAFAAVSHEIPIRLVIARVAGPEGTGFWELDLPTGAVTHLRRDDARWMLAEVTS